MRDLLGKLGRVLIGLFFAAALVFAVSQVVEAGQPCDTPHGVCTDDDDCDDACLTYNQTPDGGQCITSVGCCQCLE